MFVLLCSRSVFHKALSPSRMLTAYFVLHKRPMCKFLIETTELSMPVFMIYIEWSRWHLLVILAHAQGECRRRKSSRSLSGTKEI